MCIKDGKKNWTPQSRQKQSQLTQNGSGYGSMDDPEGVDSLVVSMAPGLIAAPFSNDVQVGSTADPAPAEAFIHHSEYIVPNELHGVSVAAASTPTARPSGPSSQAEDVGCCGESDDSASVDDSPDACGLTVDSVMVHDCLLDTWGGLEIDPAAFDAARHAIRAFMGPGYCAPDGSILRWNRTVIPLDDSACAAFFDCVCDESSSRGLCRGRTELSHGFVEAIHRGKTPRIKCSRSGTRKVTWAQTTKDANGTSAVLCKRRVVRNRELNGLAL